MRGACRIAHTDPTQAERWLTDARAGANGLRREFLDLVDDARGDDEKKLIMRMRALSERDDEAATAYKGTAFLLERMYGDTWRPQAGVEHTGKDGEPIAVAVTLTWGSPAGEPEEADLGDDDEAGSEA